MTGYQGADGPVLLRAIVTMTVPHVGNYGVNTEDPERKGLGERLRCSRALTTLLESSLRGLDRYLREAGVPGIQGIDTRALVQHIRDKGAMKAVISTDGTSRDVLAGMLADWPGCLGADSRAWCRLGRAMSARIRGCQGIGRGGRRRRQDQHSPALKEAGLRVEVFPWDSKAEDWMKDNDFVFLSNGPGDPAALDDMVDEVKKVVGTKPIVGICLGHQLLGRALGAKTFKLGFGHRGANHPVRDLETGRVEITSQNHGFCVDVEGIQAAGGEATHINLNDQTLVGFKHSELKIAAVQFHPEASPGLTTRLISWSSASSMWLGSPLKAGSVLGFFVVSLSIWLGLRLRWTETIGPHGPWASAWSGPCCCFTSPRRLSASRWSDKVGPNPSTLPLFWFVYVGMGLFSFIFTGLLLGELGLLTLGAAGEVDTSRRAFLRSAINWSVLTAAGLAGVWGIREARRRPTVVEVDVPIEGLAPDLEGFRIAQISDLHVGPTIGLIFPGWWSRR